MLECLQPYDATLSQKLLISRVIGEISRFALVKVDQGTNSVQIHRLVQAVIQSQMSEEEQGGARHEVHKILAQARPPEADADDPATWSIHDVLWPHLVPSAAAAVPGTEPQTRQLLIESWVRHQWRHGEFESCLNLARRLEDLWCHQLGPDPPADAAPAVPHRQRPALSGAAQRVPRTRHVRAGTPARDAGAGASVHAHDRERTGRRFARLW